MWRTSLEVQWLKLRASNAGGRGFNPTCCVVWQKNLKKIFLRICIIPEVLNCFKTCWHI